MIKLTREQGEVLEGFNISKERLKEQVIGFLYNPMGDLSEIFNTSELKLKATQAILDGDWEVEEPLYYVKLIDNGIGYLNHNVRFNIYLLGTKQKALDFKTKFTRAEVKAIDPRYLEFLEEVE